MSGRNPFDDVVSRPRRGTTPRDFHEASQEVQTRVKNLTEKIEAAPPQVLPDLITGEDYFRLEPQSMELIRQDQLDDQRFTHTTRMQLKDLPTHEERERAAKAIARRDPLISEQVVPVLVDDAEREIKEERGSTVFWSIIWLFTGYFSLDSMLQGNGVMGAFIVGICAFFFILVALRVVGHAWNMGGARGRAI